MAFKFKKWINGLFFCLSALLLLNTKALALDKNSSSALSHYIMGVIHDDLGQTDKAIEEYKKALKTDYQNSVIHLNLALSYLKQDNFPDAIKELNLVIKFDPEAVEPHAILALLYSTQNKSDLAAKEYESALKNASKLEPKNIDIYKSLGVIYLQQKKFEAAQHIYQLILNLAPNDAEAHFYLANTYNELTKKGPAIEALKKALELRPDYPEALNYLGYLYVEDNKELDKAEAMIKKALELDPDNGAYIDSLGWLYFRKGKFKEAVKELGKAASLLEDPVIYNHLGDAFLKTEDIENARMNWQKSLKLDPKQAEIKEKLDKIIK